MVRFQADLGENGHRSTAALSDFAHATVDVKFGACGVAVVVAEGEGSRRRDLGGTHHTAERHLKDQGIAKFRYLARDYERLSTILVDLYLVAFIILLLRRAADYVVIRNTLEPPSARIHRAQYLAEIGVLSACYLIEHRRVATPDLAGVPHKRVWTTQ